MLKVYCASSMLADGMSKKGEKYVNPKELLTTRIEPKRYKDFKAVAHIKNISMSALLRFYIAEAVRDEKSRSLEDFENARKEVEAIEAAEALKKLEENSIVSVKKKSKRVKNEPQTLPLAEQDAA